MTLGLDPLFKVLTEALVGVAGCLARSDCKERDTLAINQGSAGYTEGLEKYFQVFH